MNGDNCWEINLRFSDEGYYQSARAREKRGGREGGKGPDQAGILPEAPALTQALTLGKSFNFFMSIFLICKISLMMASFPNHFDSQMKASIKVHRIAINWAIIIFIIK